MRYLVNESEAEWQNHPTFQGVKIKVLQTQKDQDSLATIVITEVPKGVIVPFHVHEESDDILFILSGNASMEIEGIRSFQMEKGSCLRVPKAIRHQIHDVTEDLLIYDVFAPPSF